MASSSIPYQTQVLSPFEASKAVYIDFEGTQNEPPSLLGIYYTEASGQDRLRQLVFDPALIPAAEARSESNGSGACIPVGSIEEALRHLLGFVENENRMMVCWSRREADAINATNLTHNEKARLCNRLINALKPARSWLWRNHPDVQFRTSGRTKKHALQNYMKLIEFNVPWPFGSGTTAKRIRDVRAQLEKRGTYENLTGVVKRKWTNLLKHNDYDCRGTRAVYMRICQDRTS